LGCSLKYTLGLVSRPQSYNGLPTSGEPKLGQTSEQSSIEQLDRPVALSWAVARENSPSRTLPYHFSRYAFHHLTAAVHTFLLESQSDTKPCAGIIGTSELQLHSTPLHRPPLVHYSCSQSCSLNFFTHRFSGIQDTIDSSTPYAQVKREAHKRRTYSNEAAMFSISISPFFYTR
jgi:hypothetical protein